MSIRGTRGNKATQRAREVDSSTFSRLERLRLTISRVERILRESIDTLDDDSIHTLETMRLEAIKTLKHLGFVVSVQIEANRLKPKHSHTGAILGRQKVYGEYLSEGVYEAGELIDTLPVEDRSITSTQHLRLQGYTLLSRAKKDGDLKLKVVTPHTKVIKFDNDATFPSREDFGNISNPIVPSPYKD